MPSRSRPWCLTRVARVRKIAPRTVRVQHSPGGVLASRLQRPPQSLGLAAPPAPGIALRKDGASGSNGAGEEGRAARLPFLHEMVGRRVLARLEAAHEPSAGAVDAHREVVGPVEKATGHLTA